MAQHESKPLADLAASAVALQYKLCTLEQQRRFGGVFLGRELVQTTIQVLGEAHILSHDPKVPKQFQAPMRAAVVAKGTPWSTETTKDQLSALRVTDTRPILAVESSIDVRSACSELPAETWLNVAYRLARRAVPVANRPSARPRRAYGRVVGGGEAPGWRRNGRVRGNNAL